MYIHGVKQQRACMMTRTVPFLLWNLLRPALECSENSKKLQWQRIWLSEWGPEREQDEELYRSLVDQGAISL
jgi:hypothetical protein